MELNELIEYIRCVKKRRGFDETSIEQEMVLFTEEVGELAREVMNIARTGVPSEELRRCLAYEVVDCLIYLLSIAGMARIEDIEGYFRDKEDINTQRFG